MCWSEYKTVSGQRFYSLVRPANRQVKRKENCLTWASQKTTACWLGLVMDRTGLQWWSLHPNPTTLLRQLPRNQSEPALEADDEMMAHYSQGRYCHMWKLFNFKYPLAKELLAYYVSKEWPGVLAPVSDNDHISRELVSPVAFSTKLGVASSEVYFYSDWS